MKSTVILCFTLLTICLQQAPVEANWFTDMFRGLTGGRNTGESGVAQAEAAHDAIYGGGSGTQTQFQVPTGQNKGSRLRELIAAAAGYEAMRAYERSSAKKTGQQANHSMMKGILAAAAAAAVEHLAETKGMDFIDRQRAKTEAQKVAEEIVKEKYGMHALDDENTPPQPQAFHQQTMTTQAGEFR